MAKRKAEFNAVEKYTKTPHKNVQDNEFSAEFTDNNNAIRFQNRNSKQAKKVEVNGESASNPDSNINGRV